MECELEWWSFWDELELDRLDDAEYPHDLLLCVSLLSEVKKGSLIARLLLAW